MDYHVVHFMLLLDMMLLMLIGLRVLLHHASYYYCRRGGSSDVGTSCGMFFVRVDGTINGSNWDYGTALSFIYIYTLYCSWWFFLQ